MTPNTNAKTPTLQLATRALPLLGFLVGVGVVVALPVVDDPPAADDGDDED